MPSDEPVSTDTPPANVPWPPILLAGAVIAAIALGRLIPVGWPGLDDMPARIIGHALGLLGIALMVWALVTFWRARANVLPHRAATSLITTGPFWIWRHPIYMADILILLGLAQITLNLWFAVLAPVFALAVLKLAIEPEERHLEKRFGSAYLEYKSRTRRWF